MLERIPLHRNSFGRVAVAVASAALMTTSASAQTISLGAAGDFCVLGLDGVKLSMSNPQTSVSGNVGLGPAGIQNFSDGFIGGTYTADSTGHNSESDKLAIAGGTGTNAPSMCVVDAH